MYTPAKKTLAILAVLCFTALISFGQAPNISYTTPNVYNIYQPIAPLKPVNVGGAVPANAFGGVTTFAGNGNIGNTNGHGTNTSFHAPVSTVTDAAGNIYIVDSQNHQIRKITPGGDVSVFAGSGVKGNTNGNGQGASFGIPVYITIDAAGNLYVADGVNSNIRKITPNADVTTVADNIYMPYGVAVDASGNLFVSQPFNHVILKITPGGTQSVFAGSGNRGTLDGNGTAAGFNGPTGLIVDAAGNLFVADAGNSIIRKITPNGTVSTFAGNRNIVGAFDGQGTSASFNFPNGLIIDALGNMYVADTGNNLIRRISPDGTVITVAGSTSGNVDGVHKKAKFFAPIGVSVDAAGNLYVTDQGNNTVRKVQITGYAIDKDLPPGLVFDPATGIISGTPTQAWVRTRYTVTAYNLKGESSTILTIEVKPVPLPVVAPPAIVYNTPNVYALNKIISPLKPTNTGGAVPATVYGTTTIFAGTGALGETDGNGNSAQFTIPYGITTDADGNLYVTEGTSRIREIQPNGFVTTIGADGNPGAPFNVPKYNTPKGVVRDAAGNLFIANYGHHNILKITPDGIVSVFAGGTTGGGYKDGQGTAAIITWPNSIAIDAAGNLYVSDYTNRIRKISPSGYVYTIAGNGNAATVDGSYTNSSLNKPGAIAVDAVGNLYVAEQSGNVIRKITPLGNVSVFAGSGQYGTTDGPGTTATFGTPMGITIDKSGNLYVTQLQNGLIRKITPDQVVTTLAGGGPIGANEGVGGGAYFSEPYGIVVGPDGNLYVAEGGDFIKKVIATGYTIDKPLPAGLTFDVTTGIITGTPTVLWPPTDYKITAYNAGGSSSFTTNISVTEVTAIITAGSVSGNIVACKGSISSLQQFTVSGNNLTQNITVTPPLGFLISASPLGGFDDKMLLVVQGDKVNSINLYVKIANNTTAGMYSGNVTLASAGATTVNVPVNATVNALPVVQPVANQDICNSAQSKLIVFAGNATSYKWTNDNTAIGLALNGNGNINEFTAQNNTNLPQTANITVTPMAGTCEGTPETFLIIVYPTVTATVSISQVQVNCPGQLTSFVAVPNGAGPGPSFVWYVNGQVAVSSTATFSSVDLKENDVVACTVTGNDKCAVPAASNTLSVKFIQAVIPSVAIDLTGAVGVCAGNEVTLTAIAGNEGINPTYQWMVNGQLVSNAGKVYKSSTLVTGDKVTCTVTNNDGCVPSVSPVSVAADIVLTPVIALSVNISQEAVNCAGQSVNFVAVPNGATNTLNYQWTVNGQAVGNNSATFSSSTLTANDAVICNVSSTAQCSVPASSNVVNVLYKPVITPSVSIDMAGTVGGCAGAQIVLTAIPVNAGNNPTYQWFLNGQQGGGNSDKYISSTLVTGDKVTCTVTNNDGCVPSVSPASVPADIVLTPVIALSVNVRQVAVNCIGQPVSFVAVPNNATININYQWMINGQAAGNNSATFSSSTLTANDAITCNISSAASCSLPAASNIVKALYTPVVTPTVSINMAGSSCAGAELVLSAIPVNEGINPTYQWMVNGQPVSNAGKVYKSSTLVTGDKVTCTVTNNDGCVPSVSQVSVPADIVLTPVTALSVNISQEAVNCAGQPVNFVAVPNSATNTLNYQWTVNGQAVGNNSATFSSSTLTANDAVICNVSSTAQCSVPASSNVVNVLYKPVITPSVSIDMAGTVSGCVGLEIVLTAIPENAGNNPTFQWMLNGQPINNTGNKYTSTSFVTGDQVTCTVTNNDGCSPVTSANAASAYMIADPVQVSTVTIGTSVAMPVCAGKQVVFTPTPANYQLNASPPTYVWYVNGVPVSTSDNYSSKNLANGDQVYCLMTTYGKCTAPVPAQSNTITVNVTPELGCVVIPIVIPNAFTPNGDGSNDTWSIPALANYPDCTVTVFNRYGASLFRSVGYGKAWNGQYNDTDLPGGTYYYIIDPKNGQAKLSGYVLIIR